MSYDINNGEKVVVFPDYLAINPNVTVVLEVLTMTEVQKPVQIEPRAHAAKAMPKLRVPNIRPQDIGLKIFHELPSVDDVEIE